MRSVMLLLAGAIACCSADLAQIEEVDESIFDIAAHPEAKLINVKAAVGTPAGFEDCSSSDFSKVQACIDARPEIFHNDSDCEKYQKLDIWAACYVQTPCANFRNTFLPKRDVCTSEIFNEYVSVMQANCSIPLCNVVTARNRDCASIPSSKSPQKCADEDDDFESSSSFRESSGESSTESSTALIVGAWVGGVVLLGAVVGSVMKKRSSAAARAEHSAAAVINPRHALTPQV
jgi:hypothetical protein